MDAKTSDKNRRVAFQTHIDTSTRTVNKALISGSGHTAIWSILSHICSWNGEGHGALPRRDNKGGKVFASRSMISGIAGAIPHFPRRRFARRAYVPMVCGLIGMQHYGVASYRCARFSPPWNPAFRDTTLLWSTQLSCVQMSGFRVRDGLLTVRKPIRGWAPSPSFLLPFSFVRDWAPPPSSPLPFPRAVPSFPRPDPWRHINYPANGRSFGIIRNLIHVYKPCRALVLHACAYVCIHTRVYVYWRYKILKVF